uniref:Uncharacterized protein n=1 Tax=Cucumis melo TaxID=3656 RepID=A0A9I9EDF2_CUCME
MDDMICRGQVFIRGMGLYAMDIDIGKKTLAIEITLEKDTWRAIDDIRGIEFGDFAWTWLLEKKVGYTKEIASPGGIFATRGGPLLSRILKRDVEKFGELSNPSSAIGSLEMGKQQIAIATSKPPDIWHTGCKTKVCLRKHNLLHPKGTERLVEKALENRRKACSILEGWLEQMFMGQDDDGSNKDGGILCK